MSNAPEPRDNIYERIAALETKVDRVLEIHEKIMAFIDEHKQTVIDVIDGLEKNPMLKMFTGGRR